MKVMTYTGSDDKDQIENFILSEEFRHAHAWNFYLFRTLAFDANINSRKTGGPPYVITDEKPAKAAKPTYVMISGIPFPETIINAAHKLKTNRLDERYVTVIRRMS